MLGIERILESDDFGTIFLKLFHGEFLKPTTYMVCFYLFKSHFFTRFHTVIVDMEMRFSHRMEMKNRKYLRYIANNTIMILDNFGKCKYFLCFYSVATSPKIPIIFYNNPFL